MARRRRTGRRRRGRSQSREQTVQLWLRTASPRQFSIVVFVGAPLAVLGLGLLMPYIIAGILVFSFFLGMFLMQFGGIVIGGVSLLEKTGEYESPYWFSVVKWGTLPLRWVDSVLSVGELLFDSEYGRGNVLRWKRER